MAEIPLLLEFLAADNASLYVVPETHFLATRNNNLSINVLVYRGGDDEAEYCDSDISEYQFLATMIYYTLIRLLNIHHEKRAFSTHDTCIIFILG